MYIVSVVPLVSTLPKEELSYYTKSPLSKSTLVQIKVRKKLVYGLVRECVDVKNAKAMVRSSSFGMKKIDSVVRKKLFTESFLNAAEDLARKYVLPLGAILEVFTPKDLLEVTPSLPEPAAPSRIQENKTRKPEAIQAPQQERLLTYEKAIKETFKVNRSVFLTVPDHQTGAVFQEYYEKRFKESVYFFHSALSKKKNEQKTKQALESKEPVLVISTPIYLSLPRPDVGTVILECENKESYRRQKRPFIDTRVFVEDFAAHLKARFLIGGSVLRTETFTRIQSNLIKSSKTYRTTLPQPPEAKLFDMTKYRKDEEGFKLFAPEISAKLEKNIAAGKKIFIFALRKGLASVTLCRDCGTTIFCPDCSVPLSLTETKSGREFACTKCGFTQDARTRLFCDHCGGFQLEAFGLGIDTVRAELERRFPDTSVIQLDSTKTKTRPSTLREIQKFNQIEQTQPAILLGTEMAINYLPENIDMSIVATLDTLFTIPNFRINHKIFTLLSEIAEKTKDVLYIQSRNPKSELLQTFLSGDIQKFHKTDLAERKRFDFPPFSTFIKITTTVKTSQEKTQQDKIEYFFAKYDPAVYPGFVERVKKRYVINTLIRLERNEKIPEDLRKRLAALPPDYEVRIDPESIL